MRILHRNDFVVAYCFRVARDVLHSAEGGTIPGGAQRVQQVLVVVVQLEAAMRQSQHAAGMRRLTG
jgi:hypothetical protein